jgi:hypothetical protein
MLGKRRTIYIDGKKVKETPLFVPSFSSKLQMNLDDTFTIVSDAIMDTYLVSAFDLHHGFINKEVLNVPPDILFLDSGGYETNAEKADPKELAKEYTPNLKNDWKLEYYQSLLNEIELQGPTSIVSYDHADLRQSFENQVKDAATLFSSINGVAKEILIKPTSKDHYYLDVDEICKRAHLLADFDIIGVTDKELGPSLHLRMENIYKIRQALNKLNLDKPIHIFGSLDTITSPLYFLCGADIFDGLTWLKFAFHEGQTVYMPTTAALKERSTEKDYLMEKKTLYDNVNELANMQLTLRAFLKEEKYDYAVFGPHKQLFKTLIESIA